MKDWQLRDNASWKEDACNKSVIQWTFCQSDEWVQSAQSFSRVWLFATLWTAACRASLSITNSWSLLKLMSIELLMPSNHLILCHPLLLLPSVFPSIRVFSNESVFHIRWPLVTQSCLTLCDPMDCSPLGFSVHGILQARAVEWIAIPFAIWGHKGAVYQVIPELSRGSAFPPHFCFSLPSSPHSQTTHVEKHSVPSSGQLQGLSKVWVDGAEGDSAKEIIWPKVHFGKEQTGDLS